MIKKKEKAASGKAASCQIGNAKNYLKYSKKGGNIQSIFCLGEDSSEFPVFFQIFVLPRKINKGGEE